MSTLRWPAVAALALLFPWLCACGKPAQKAPPATSTATASRAPVTASLSGHPPSALHLDAVDFLNRQIGWLAGHRGSTVAVLRTLNGGATWEALPAGRSTFLALDFISPDTGWALVAAGGDVQIERTADGGATWAVQWVGQGADMGALMEVEDARIRMLSGTSGHALFGGLLLATADAGATWSALALPDGFTPTGMAWQDAQGGWVAGMACPVAAATGTGSSCRVRVLQTADGGVTWTGVFTSSAAAMPLAAGAGLPGLSFPTAGQGWLYFKTASLAGRLYTTTDGGASWTREQADLAGGRGVSGLPVFAGASAGWLPRDGGASPLPGGIAVTRDGGQTWTWVGSQRGWSITGLSAVSATDAWAIGRRAGAGATTFLIKSTDGGATWSENALTLRPTGAVDFVSARLGYGAGAASDPGAVLATTDGGALWSVRARLPGTIAAISFTDAEHGWALERPWPPGGHALAVLASSDGGATWTQVARMAQSGPPVPQGLRFFDTLHGVLTIEARSGWLVLSSADGGHTWSQSGHIALGQSAAAVPAMPAPTDLLVLESAPALVRSGDGGASWTGVPGLPAGLGRGVGLGAAGTRDLWALVRARRRTLLLRSANAGGSWSRVALPAAMALDPPLSVAAISASAAWVLSAEGLFATRDGGRAWSWLR